MAKIIRFTGNNHITCDLIYEFQKKLEGRNLIIDTVVGQRKLPIKYHIEDQIVYDFYDYLKGDINLYKAIIEINDNLDFVPSSYIEGKDNFDQEILDNLSKEFEEYDYVLLNSNDYFNEFKFDNTDNIIVGEDGLEGNNYFITDKKISSRIYTKSNLDYQKAFELYKNKEEFKPSFVQKIKELFN